MDSKFDEVKDSTLDDVQDSKEYRDYQEYKAYKAYKEYKKFKKFQHKKAHKHSKLKRKYHKLAYHHKLFLMALLFSWSMIGFCLIFQYGRESNYKISQFDWKLQMFNSKMIEAFQDGKSPEEFLAETNDLPYPDTRVSIINDKGAIVFDNTLDQLPRTNHLKRPEIAEAIKNGTGYTLRRHSSSNGENYFYSAMAEDGYIVRTAVPYSSISVAEMLTVDREFIRFMVVAGLIISVLVLFATYRLGNNMKRLTNFAEQAEHGDKIDADTSFPNDELGEISSHIVRLFARLQDAVSERDKQHEKALHEEQEKIRIKKQLTNNINHELKTPVAAIQICLETLLQHDDLPKEKQREFLSRSFEHCERLRGLLNDVSMITRMEDGNEAIAKDMVDLAPIIRKMVSELPEDSNVTVNCNIPDEILLSGNITILTSLFQNLISNAMVYSGCDTITIDIDGGENGCWNVRFADNGCGVEPEHLPHLFERFYRVDKGRSRQLGGTGLGLAIVKNAVTIHGGTIAVDNAPTGGLVFTFTLRRD
jgi:signal transduction histidine kinase